MPFITALALIAALAVLIRHIIYRRQVERLCRRVEFINNNKTMQKLSVDLRSRELIELADRINQLNDRVRETEVAHMRQDEALRETIANLSHDIRTPLTSLDGYFQLLSAEDITPEKREYYTGIIKSRITSLNDMLDELFTYAKLQDPNYAIELAPMDIVAISADTVISFYDDIKKSGSEPKVEFPEESIMVNGNKNAYTRVVQNIVKNALVHGKNLSIVMHEENGKVIFSCEDELMDGTEEVDISRVFDRFYKADKARGTKGSGLGLAISKELTEKMGGQISASCENGIFAIKLAFEAAK